MALWCTKVKCLYIFEGGGGTFKHLQTPVAGSENLFLSAVRLQMKDDFKE